MGSGDTWSGLQLWADSVAPAWVHSRDITTERLVAGECVCARTDCVISLFKKFRTQQEKAEKGSLEIMAKGQSSPLGRYPSTSFQVCVGCSLCGVCLFVYYMCVRDSQHVQPVR